MHLIRYAASDKMQGIMSQANIQVYSHQSEANTDVGVGSALK